MIVKILGLLDLLTAVMIVFVQLGFLPGKALYFFAAYLIIKGVMFIKSGSSIIDLVCAVYIVFMVFGLRFFLAYLVAVYLFQKAVVSLA